MNAVVQPVQPADEKALAGPNVLLLGEGGTGKTYSLGTLADWCQAHGKEMFVLFVENSLETLLGYWRDQGKDVPSCLHWHQSLTQALSLKQLTEGAKAVGDFSYELLTKRADPNRSANNAFYKILQACADFKDDRTGKAFGPVDQFGLDKVFCLDSFTELGNAAAKMVIGSKPTMAPPEYGVAQQTVMGFLRLCTQAVPATFIMTAHPSKEKDEISGSIKTGVSTGGIGTAIIPQIPPLFSDVIWCVREGSKFTWDTAAYGVTTKTRSLGYKSGINPDFGQIMDLWVKRGGK
jgi:hypothetical protein